MKILVGGDTVPTESNERIFQDGDAARLIGQELLEVIQDHDYFVINLETPLICQETPIEKSGPVLGANQAVINGYKRMRVNAVSLANNHILDHGNVGLCSTIQVLKKNDIHYFGAGFTYEEAIQCHFVTIDNVRLGFYSCCENEFSVFSTESGGANGYDALETFEHIRHFSTECDYLIVLYHGGKEEYRYPTPQQRRIMRKMVDCGAKAVIAQHSHCIGCGEEYHGAKLIYGQGNFIFDESANSCWNSGLLLSINVDSNQFYVTEIPVVREKFLVRKATFEEADSILADFHWRSAEIMQPGFVERQFEERAKNEKVRVLRKMHGDTFAIKILTKLFPGFLNKYYYNGQKRRAALNLIRCESHRETLETVLRSE